MKAASPAFAGLDAGSVTEKPQVVFTKLAGDLNTPVGAYLKLSVAFGPGFLLESVQGGAARGRYSILGFAPDLILRAEQAVVTITQNGAAQTSVKSLFETLRDVLAQSRLDLPADLAPMAAGIFGVLSYDCVRELEKIGSIKPDPLRLPRALLLRPTLIVVFDSVRDEIVVVSPCRTGDKAANDKLQKAVVCLQSNISSPHPKSDLPDLGIIDSNSDKSELHGEARRGASSEVKTGCPHPDPPPAGEGIKSNTPREDYLSMVARAKEYIAAGDAFQIVLSQRFETGFSLPSFELYRALRRTNPSPYLFYFDFGDYALAGSSPEICVQLRGDKVTLRPIAGTIRRGKSPAEDKALGEKLLSDPKERAEHLMLLDLGRNDVGRVSEIGSVAVEEQFTLEHYSEVSHIVSQVSGKLKTGLDCIDVLGAAFPAGTVSGAPKVRAMQIINELERDHRGFYAGIAGYFSANGDMDTAIILRTGLVKDGMLYVQAGAGIVADSIPENEHAECEVKARALFRAAEVAGGGA
jgi:anthranilate synthase component 1